MAIAALYFYDLNGIGIYGPDEPRYAAIGWAMAASHDFVTPKLWGVPWFEKPPLLYWMTALGASFRLGPELAGRVPVVVLSLGYLAGSWWAIKRIYNFRVALAATVSLGTCAGWLAYSSFCLTDLPMSVFFSVALLIALTLVEGEVNPGVRWRLAGIGAALGLATLAKGLVPIVLALPFAWFLRRYWKLWWITAAACLLVAGPWYLLVYQRNGYAFVEEFFLKHHIERLYSPALLHVKPFYYYVPVMLGALFPWTPLVVLLAGQKWDTRRRFLAATVAFGFLFFSLSRNKLSGYILPLLPALFLLLASALEHRRLADLPKRWLVASALLIACIPLLIPVLPESLMQGRLALAPLSSVSKTEIFYVILPLAALVAARRSQAPTVLALCFVASTIFLKAKTYPSIDAKASPRQLWGQTESIADQTCDGGTNRDWILGLSFYRRRSYELCENGGDFRYAFRTHRRGIPDLEPLKH